MPSDYVYEGSELELFSHAQNWKAYWGANVRPYLGDRVLEVGAGIGSTAEILCDERHSIWLALEPDAKLADQMRRRALPKCCKVELGTLADLAPDRLFDTILYIDVLEHIEDDRAELQLAARHLDKGGHLVVLAPAHQHLYTDFDAAIGHYRRYDRGALLALTPEELVPRQTDYLDSVGLLASLGNRFVLKSASPTRSQIKLWDSWMVPLSRFLDPVIGHRLGKSVLAVWTKPGDH
jgi:SAM-dependent methyltransferase